MADAHVELDESVSKHAREYLDAIRRVRKDFDILKAHGARMTKMLETGTDGSQAAHHAEIVEQYAVQGDEGTTALERAKLLRDETTSAVGNSAALEQLLAIVG